MFLLLIIVITLNTVSGSLRLAAALLAAALAGAVPTAVVGTTRLARLRRTRDY